MISHMIIISYIALPHAHAHQLGSPSPHCSSAAEIFNFRLLKIRIHSNARNSIILFALKVYNTLLFLQGLVHSTRL